MSDETGWRYYSHHYLPVDCNDLRNNCRPNTGVYEIYPFGTSSRPIRVYCDMDTMDGGWTITKGKVSSLYVSIKKHKDRLYELYDQFSVSNEAEKYKLFLAGPATGTLGDSMLNTALSRNNLSGMYFSTPDRDNDRSDKNCANSSSTRGGWWFNSCRIAFLNGPWYPASWSRPWYPTVISGIPVKETMMLIKHH
ncbi:fibroleukin-like [Saccostrea echinata]|uniref:fibroleukin-like n=1 Tax=Saccostrea echinata TaxID=191078 RepID=UPI002A81BD80|nr:fibroleukin-like [Saccostrea echinata]